MKEINEVLPVVARLLRWVAAQPEIRNSACSAGEPAEEGITIVDLCSGVGYMSMLLNELLAEEPRVARFVLVDNSFPLQGHRPKKHHINPDHLVVEGFWPKEMLYRRYDLKKSRGHKQLAEHVLSRCRGPVALAGVHLCGVLSIRAVHIFNEQPRCSFLALKPCCLPGFPFGWPSKRAWLLGGHTIDATAVCDSGKYNKGKWVGNTPKGSLGP